MDIKSMLDQFLQAGKDMAQKSQTMAEEKLGVPEDQAGRDSMLKEVGTGAAAAGVLALLLGTGAGRRVTGAAVKVGSLAALSGLAYKMYQQWQATNTSAGDAQAAATPEPAQLEAPQAPKASVEVLLKAMIAAAKADGHVDADELEKIRKQLADVTLDGSANDMVMQALTQPLDAKGVAALAKGDMAVATELYLVSAAVIDQANDAEKAYLEDLRAALQLPEEVAKTAVSS